MHTSWLQNVKYGGKKILIPLEDPSKYNQELFLGQFDFMLTKARLSHQMR